VKIAGGRATWLRRGFIAVVLVGAAVSPGQALSQQAGRCEGARCHGEGSILWKRWLPGTWLAQPGVAGTLPKQSAAYVASAGQLAVVGYGTRVLAFSARTGKPVWGYPLTGLPPGSEVTSVRAWPAAVAVGVASQSSAAAPAVAILAASTGRPIRTYPSAASGGAVYADGATTVVVGAHAVTGYDNATGRARWRRATGSAPQDWYVEGRYLYVSVSSGGYLRSSAVTAVRRISLHTGAELTLRPPGRAFTGTLSGVVDGVLLFSGNDGTLGYNSTDGALLWRRAADVPAFVDAAQGILYVDDGDVLTGLDPGSGAVLSSRAARVTASLYTVSDGVALGLDQGTLGRAWGYSLAANRVVWASGALLWPHFFVDPSGLGGSVSQPAGVVLLTSCAQTGPAAGSRSTLSCKRPELAAIRF
jgi:outer membrane protein assembly factor BamB